MLGCGKLKRSAVPAYDFPAMYVHMVCSAVGAIVVELAVGFGSDVDANGVDSVVGFGSDVKGNGVDVEDVAVVDTGVDTCGGSAGAAVVDKSGIRVHRQS